ncbi:MAG TPA: hypothetical protein VIK89_00490, partial [Cytophagaceae bacterium]
YKILEEGINQLKRFGPGFSLDDLCAAINISQKTFYSFYQSKNYFLQQLLLTLVNDWRLNLQNSTLVNKDIKNTIISILTYHIDELIEFNVNFLRNLRTKFPKESLIIDGYYNELTQELLSILTEGKKNNQVRKDYNLKAFLEKEKVFFEYLLTNYNILIVKDDYLKLLELSLDSILIRRSA